ncbi:MAG: hypothetical protein J3K34DRAFT_462337 [Monoraphidium minutum]|nr:MAG: hypothetical protein J3K34DRAFT_462337 [Monoraphidium minutum]
MQALIEWVESQGGRFLKVAPDPAHPRRLVAAESIEAGESVFCLPQRLLLHGGRAFADPEYGPAFSALAAEAGAALDGRGLLVLLLAIERRRGAAGAWGPYVAFLPDAYDDPFWWSGPERALLRGTRLAAAARLYEAGLDAFAGWLARLEELRAAGGGDGGGCGGGGGGCEAGPPPGGGGGAAALRAEARWARSAVWSRAFAVRGVTDGVAGAGVTGGSTGGCGAAAGGAVGAGGGGGGGAAVVCLVPLLDMADHGPAQRVAWHTGPRGGGDFEFVTQRPIARGAEIFNNYGTSKPNEELLLGFGFCLEGNPNARRQPSPSRLPPLLRRGRLPCTPLASSAPQPNSPSTHNPTSPSLDAFLVTPASGGGPAPREPASADGERGGAAGAAAAFGAAAGACLDEGACQEEAEAGQRARLLAAAALPSEVPITLADPLPPRLLDLMAVHALPPWRARPPLAAAAAARRAAGGGGDEAGGGGGAPRGMLFEGLGLAQRLDVLQALVGALEGRLAGMSAPPLECDAAAGAAGGVGEEGGEVEVWRSPRGRLAAVYVASQRAILTTAAAAARAAAAALCVATAPPAAPEEGQGDAAAVAVAAAAEAQAEAEPAEQWQLLEGVEAAAGAGAGCGGAWAARRRVPEGAAWLRVPLAACVAAGDAQALVWTLMGAAFWELTGDQRRSEGEEEQKEGDVEGEQEEEQRWQEESGARRAAPPPRLRAWLLPLLRGGAFGGAAAALQSGAAGAALEGTAVGERLQDAAEQAQATFEAAAARLRAAPGALRAAAAAAAGGAAASGGDSAEAEQLEALLAWPGAARLHWWASEVAARGAVTAAAAAAAGGGGTAGAPLLVVAPVLCELPPAQRHLLTRCALEAAPSGARALACRAACEWPAGCVLGGAAAALAGLALEDALASRGAAAAAAAVAAAGAPPASCVVVSVAPGGGGEDGGGEEGRGEEGGGEEGGEGEAGGGGARGTKLEILAASGVGVDHAVSAEDGPGAVRAILAAMALCLATPEELEAAAPTTGWPTLLARWRAARRARAAGPAAPAPGAAEGAAAAPGAGAPAAAAAAAGEGGAGPDAEWAPLFAALLAAHGAAARQQLKAALADDRRALSRAAKAAAAALAAARGGGGAAGGAEGCVAYASGALAAAEHALGLLKSLKGGGGGGERARSGGGGGGGGKRARRG